MANYRTYEQYVGWIEDNAAWGTWQAPTMFMYFPKLAVPTINQEQIFADSARGFEARHIADLEPGYTYGQFTIGAQMPVITSDPSFLFLLKHILPNVTIAGAGANKTHTFLPYESDYALGLSFALAFGGTERYKLAGCSPTRLKLSGGAKLPLLWEMDFLGTWVGRDQTMDVPAVTLKATHPIWWSSPRATVTLDFPTGSTLSNFSTWELTYTVNRDPGDAISGELGSVGPVQLPRLGTSLSATITRRADFADGAGANQSIFNEYWEQLQTDGGALTDVQMKIFYEDGAIGVTGANYTFQLEANVAIDPDQPAPSKVMDAGGLLGESIVLTGYMDGTNELLKVTTISECVTPATGTPP